MTVTAATPKVGTPTRAFGPAFVAPLLIGTALNAVNSSMIAVTLVPIGSAFDVGPAQTAWLVTVLYLATAVGQPTMGWFVDRYGPRRVLLAGLVLVAVAGLGGLLATNFATLIAVRIVLGLGTSTAFPSAMAIVRDRAGEHGIEVPSGVLTALATSTQASMAIGPTLGGLLVWVADWRLTFAINLPLAITGFVLALRWLPSDRRRARKGVRVDAVGIGLFVTALTLGLLFVMNPGIDTWYLAVGAIGLASLLVRWELRHESPFLDLRMLGANKPLLLTYARQALAYLVIYSFLYGYTQWLVQGRGMAEAQTGLVLLPMSITTVLLAAFGGKLAGVRARLIATATLLAVGAVSLVTISQTSWIGFVVLIGFCFGVGQGLSSLANQTALYAQAPAGRMGTVSGLFRTSQYIGALAASTVIATFFGARATDAGLHGLAIVLAVAGVLLIALTFVDRSLRRVAA